MVPALYPILFGAKNPVADLYFVNGSYQLGATSTSVVSNLPGYSFSRASTGYARDVAGTLLSFASGVPRITNYGYLSEPSRTNLIVRSQEFETASWAYNGASVVANQATAPDGTLTADKLTSTTGDNYAYPTNSALIAGAAGNPYSLSGFFKDIDATNVELVMGASTPSQTYAARYNLSTGVATVTTSSGGGTVTAVMVQLVNGWWWCALQVSAVASSTYCEMQYRITSAAKSVYVWGAQFELGSWATSYIPTTTTSVTRAADAMLIDGLSVVSPWSMVVNAYMNSNLATGVQKHMASLSIGADSNNRTIQFLGLSNNAVIQTIISGSAPLNVSSTFSAGGSLSEGVSVSGVNSAAAINGVDKGSAASSGYPSALTRLGVGCDYAGSSQAGAYIKRLLVVPFTFSNAELQTLTAP